MQRTPVESESAASIGYDTVHRFLEVEYRDGGVYRYHDVPPEEYELLRNADSIGAHLNREVKPRYRYEKVA